MPVLGRVGVIGGRHRLRFEAHQLVLELRQRHLGRVHEGPLGQRRAGQLVDGVVDEREVGILPAVGQGHAAARSPSYRDVPEHHRAQAALAADAPLLEQRGGLLAGFAPIADAGLASV